MHGGVAAIAAEVIKNPSAVVVAARRYLGAIGTEHEGAAAVELLGMVGASARPNSGEGPAVDSGSGRVAE